LSVVLTIVPGIIRQRIFTVKAVCYKSNTANKHRDLHSSTIRLHVTTEGPVTESTASEACRPGLVTSGKS